MKDNTSLKDQKPFQNIIWEGRFQPIHRGHLAYMDKLITLGNRLYIVVVANEHSSEVYKNPKELPVPFFSEEVDKHHRAEKNVFPYNLCYCMVIQAVKERFGENAPIVIMSGRRLDLAWDLYKKILPPERVFVTPMRDAFEDIKARAWQALGEANYRVHVKYRPPWSGRLYKIEILKNFKIF